MVQDDKNENDSWMIQAAIKKAFPKVNMTLPWVNFCDKMFKLQPVLKITIVCWEMPKPSTLKLNTDRSYTSSINNAGLEGILRDCKGNMIMAFSQPANCSNNIIAEAQATKLGIEWCVQNGYNDFTLELDSLEVIQMIIDKQANNYKLLHIIMDISQILSQANVIVSHYFREANNVSNYLAKSAKNSQQGSFYYTFEDLPRGAKGPFMLDKFQMPTIRLRYDKANLFVS
ncbi:uncharacterized protein LOC142178041 [Nicotiana tabacum]|uniref:Uncharacterized protein LOC142178041 n=1 Tax=Nicotiana tabacum TaxID=4097 RepID=A0AC58U1U3_TOBAC